MNKIIVLGNRGFVGRNLVEYLRTRTDQEVLGLSSDDLNLEKGHELPVKLEGEAILIICSGLKRNHGEITEVFDRNMQIARNLYHLTLRKEFKKIVYMSSCAVYGEDVAHAEISESQMLTPTSFYGISKASTEYLLQKSCGDRLIILRPPTIYAGESDPKNYDPYGFLCKISANEQIQLWGDGSELREFLYLDDLLKLTKEVISSAFTGTLNVCSGTSYTFQDIIQISQKLSGKTPIQSSKERSKEKVDHRFNPSALLARFPEFKFTSLEEGLAAIYKKEFARG